MNQDQAKERLLEIRQCKDYFSVTFSGKSSKKVDGLYKPDTREIILHNKNFVTDQELMYTAIHEYSHHIQFSSSPVPLSTRVHTAQFWSLFHGLLYTAEKIGLYKNPFDSSREFVELTKMIKEKFLTVNGKLMKELGELLCKARSLCEKYRTSFTDYLDRILSIPRTGAAAMMKTHVLNIDPKIGFENMRSLTRIRDPQIRKEAETSLLSGKSPDMVRVQYMAPDPAPGPIEHLTLEKVRIEKHIKRLQDKVTEINRRLEEYRARRKS